MAMKRDFELLPSEITADILSRVVADSVFNCKLVCKTWRSHINHPFFINDHTRHVSLNHSSSLSMDFFVPKCFNPETGKWKLHLGEYDEGIMSFKLSKPITHHPMDSNFDMEFDPLNINSCNGLIFTASTSNPIDILCIYNPFTTEYVDLLPSFVSSGIFSEIYHKKCIFVNGFGYLDSTNEYKIVRICFGRDKVMGHVSVYTLGSGQWRSLGEIPHRLMHTGVFANGVIYWLELLGKWRGLYKNKRIVLFDLDDEEFRTVSLPNLPVEETHSVQLGVLRGCLCVISPQFVNDRIVSSDIWMTNNKECSSWIMKFNVPLECDLTMQDTLVGITKGGKILLHDYYDGFIFSYDPKTNGLSRADNAPPDLKRLHMIPYTKSFVCLKGLGEEDAKVTFLEMNKFLLLPPEITADILSRVPADSIFDCKLVCKTWRSLINHSSFVDAHTRHVFLGSSDAHTRHVFLGSSASMGFFICTYFIGRVEEFKVHLGEYNEEEDYDEAEECNEEEDYDDDEVEEYSEEEEDYDDEVIPFKLSEPITKHPYPLAPNNMDSMSQFDSVIVSSCNGLIFAGSMLNPNDLLYIYNPFTKEYVDLVSSFTTDSISYGIHDKCFIGNGFGYNHSTNEYKIVRICHSEVLGLGHACVYTLGSGKWRNKGEIPHSLCGRGPGVFANGAIYWLERHGKMGIYKRIVLFDLDDEEFRIVPSPSAEETSYNELGVLRGCLCVISAKYVNGESSSDIWITNNKECSSWTRKFNVPGKCGLLQSELVAISKGGKILLHNYDDGCLFSYDTKTESLSEIENAPALKRFHMIHYKKSFVSLKGLGEKDAKCMDIITSFE